LRGALITSGWSWISLLGNGRGVTDLFFLSSDFLKATNDKKGKNNCEENQ